MVEAAAAAWRRGWISSLGIVPSNDEGKLVQLASILAGYHAAFAEICSLTRKLVKAGQAASEGDPPELSSRSLPYFTIGHSTRPLNDFIELLRAAEISLIVDVRTMPRSCTSPQYNKEGFTEALAVAGVDYEHAAALGGLRKRAHGVPPHVNAFWRNQSFHNYADYALSEEFHLGLRRLRESAQARRCAIMCAEAVWWRCHRRIIADHLIAAGEAVFHILGRGQVKRAQMTGAAKRGRTGRITYPLPPHRV